MRQEVLAHSNAGILDCEAKRRFIVQACNFFDHDIHLPARRREFDGIAKNIDENLPQFHIVADVVVVDLAIDMALVVQSFLLALAAENGVDVLDQLGKGELLVLERHPSGFDAGHVQNVVDQIQQMVRAVAYFGQVVFDFRRRLRIVHGDVVQPDDGVHRSPDLMGHVGKKDRFGLVGLLGGRQGVAERVALLLKLLLQGDALA